MEELRSTEILDREIQEDARRKADKILKAAESDCVEIEREAAGRFEKMSARKKEEYEQMLSSYRKDSEAAVPLEKQRRLISYIDRAVQGALDSWFASAEKEKKLRLLGGLLVKYSAAVEGKKINILYRGYGEKDISNLVSERLKNVPVVSMKELSNSEAKGLGLEDGFFIQTEDGCVFCRVTCKELRDELLQEHREELAVKLLGADIFSAAGSSK